MRARSPLSHLIQCSLVPTLLDQRTEKALLPEKYARLVKLDLYDTRVTLTLFASVVNQPALTILPASRTIYTFERDQSRIWCEHDVLTILSASMMV